MNYLDLQNKARSLGCSWTFNTVEGLEFAIDFLSKQVKINDGHRFLDNFRCANCGIDKKIIMMLPAEYRKYNNKEQCSTFKHLKARGIDVENLLKGKINELSRNY